ncbi:MAG TPA: gephyrin-like molybdotransferase Glp [Candidatus Dormibacteraeota bacterium]|jgi:molybdopterin molybdotransferase|nr:gephyrin-like molybdotransferase Glp [Candidatus Dormibacteraeota bacterium]
MAKAAGPSSKTVTGTIGNPKQPPLLTVAQARDRILARISVLDAEDTPLTEARGRVLAEDVRSDRDVPPFTNSAMDGYAVRAGDTSAASAADPVRLEVLGEIRAGVAPPTSVRPSTALRIMTGAVMPEGADAVVRVEDTAERDGRVDIRVAVEPGTSVRHAGSDLRRGDRVAERGRIVTPGLIGVLASTGRTTVRTIRRPRVTVLTTGDELRDAGESLGPGQITNTNRYTLRAALEEAGAEVVDAGVARDVREELVARLQSAARTDLIVSTGGVSMGAYDLVRALLEEQGAVDFWQVALRPGKPLMVGTVEGRPLIGLPGNPVSSLVGVELFVRPAILKMQGRSDLERPRLAAITDVALSNPPHLEQYFRGIARRDGDRVRVRLTGDQGSHVLRSMADANCLIVVPLGTSEVAAGRPVEIIPLAPID